MNKIIKNPSKYQENEICMQKRRFLKMKNILDKRQVDVHIITVSVAKDHNLSAIARTADACGVHNVHAINQKENASLVNAASSGSMHWLNFQSHKNFSDATLKLPKNTQLFATGFSSDAVSYEEVDYTKSFALILGHEKNGLEKDILNQATKVIKIPMQGMVQSLNVSVASAIILYKMQEQRAKKNLYCTSKISDEQRNKIYFLRGYPRLSKIALLKKLPIPKIDFKTGDILAPSSWWQKLQSN